MLIFCSKLGIKGTKMIEIYKLIFLFQGTLIDPSKISTQNLYTSCKNMYPTINQFTCYIKQHIICVVSHDTSIKTRSALI